MKKRNFYKSGSVHTSENASEYSKTHELPHRFLAYRGFTNLLDQYPSIRRVLDLGCGTGSSSKFLQSFDLETVGVDKSPSMVCQAKQNFSEVYFTGVENLKNLAPFDLVFSSFVLFELQTLNEITKYLRLASSHLKNDGIFYGVTGSEDLHIKHRNWMCFETNFEENSAPKSGDIVKLGLRDPQIVFEDYYWTESDYIACFQNSDLEVLKISYPLGKKEDNISWRDELFHPPFVVFIAKKTHSTT